MIEFDGLGEDLSQYPFALHQDHLDMGNWCEQYIKNWVCTRPVGHAGSHECKSDDEARAYWYSESSEL